MDEQRQLEEKKVEFTFREEGPVLDFNATRGSEEGFQPASDDTHFVSTPSARINFQPKEGWQPSFQT